MLSLPSSPTPDGYAYYLSRSRVPVLVDIRAESIAKFDSSFSNGVMCSMNNEQYMVVGVANDELYYFKTDEKGVAPITGNKVPREIGMKLMSEEDQVKRMMSMIAGRGGHGSDERCAPQ